MFYKQPLPKTSGDFQWRIVNGAVASNAHIAHLTQGTVGSVLSVLSMRQQLTFLSQTGGFVFYVGRGVWEMGHKFFTRGVCVWLGVFL